MPAVQTKIDLPIRKTGRTRKTVNKEEKLDVKPKSNRAKIEEPEPTTPRGRSRRRAAAQVAPQSPGKRHSDDESRQECLQLSPTKISKTPAKERSKENLAGSIPLTPSTHFAKLALHSPRQPLGLKCNQPKVEMKKGSIFSPRKNTVDSIANLLTSPDKSETTSKNSLPTTPVKALFSNSPKKSHNVNDPLFRSPLKPVSKSRTPAKSPIHPNKSTRFPSDSPQRWTVDALEDALFSPTKSPPKNPPNLVHRSPRKPLTPAKLSASPSKRSLFSPTKSPKPASTLFQADVSQFQIARAALHTGTPSYLLCRDTQVSQMSMWLDKHIVKGIPGSIYVSGAPGTGKTATLVSLLNGKVAKYKSIFINCMVLKSAIAIYREVAQQLKPKSNPKTEKAALKIIEEAITDAKEMILLVLDEVDQLESKDQSVLYTVFEWPALQGSKFALVGIANSLDLTDRVLPRLQVKPAYMPTLLHYPPYTKQQIIEILTARLQEGAVKGTTSVITPRAIAFLASKISSLSGDLRKALDVCRRALELAEGQVRKQTLLKPMTPKGLANPLTSPRKGYKNPKALPQIGQVDLPQILKVVNQVYGSQVSANLGTQGEGLPVQQKILIASLLLMVKKGRTKEVTLGKLIETYCKVLKKRAMKPELESACVGMIEMLESRGMVTYICKGAPRMAKVSLRMDEDEVGLAFGDKAMLGAIIEDVSCIAK